MPSAKSEFLRKFENRMSVVGRDGTVSKLRGDQAPVSSAVAPVAPGDGGTINVGNLHPALADALMGGGEAFVSAAGVSPAGSPVRSSANVVRHSHRADALGGAAMPPPTHMPAKKVELPVFTAPEQSVRLDLPNALSCGGLSSPSSRGHVVPAPVRDNRTSASAGALHEALAGGAMVHQQLFGGRGPPAFVQQAQPSPAAYEAFDPQPQQQQSQLAPNAFAGAPLSPSHARKARAPNVPGAPAHPPVSRMAYGSSQITTDGGASDGGDDESGPGAHAHRAGANAVLAPKSQPALQPPLMWGAGQFGMVGETAPPGMPPHGSIHGAPPM